MGPSSRSTAISPCAGQLHTASGPDALVLTHGAGSDHRAPLLTRRRRRVRRRGREGTCAAIFPFDRLARRGHRRRPPPSAIARGLPPLSRRSRRAAAASSAVTRTADARRRCCSRSLRAIAHGLLLLSYPLHPPGKPERARTAHLPGIRVPVLFVHGERDPFGSIAEIEAARALITAPTSLMVVPRAAHALPADAQTAREIAARFLGLIAESDEDTRSGR